MSKISGSKVTGAKKIIFTNLDFQIYKTDFEIVIEKRALLIGIFSIVLAIVSFCSSWMSHHDETLSTRQFLEGFSISLLVLSLLCAVVFTYIRLSKHKRIVARFDINQRTLLINSKVFDFHQIKNFQFFSFAENYLILKVILSNATEIPLFSINKKLRSRAEEIQDLLIEVVKLGNKDQKAMAPPYVSSTENRIDPSPFIFAVTLGIGLVLFIFGYFLFPNFYITSIYNSSFVLPSWVLGVIVLVYAIVKKWRTK